MSHYSDHCLKYQKQRFERLKAFLKQKGFSKEDAMKVLSEMKNRPELANDKPGKPAAKPKPAAKAAPVSTEEDEDPAAKMRGRELQFAQVDKIVQLLRWAAKEGLTLQLTDVVEGTNYCEVLDTGATNSIAASRIVSDPRRKNVCAVTIGDAIILTAEGRKKSRSF